MRKLIVVNFIFMFLLCESCFSQSHSLKRAWDRIYGGHRSDALSCFIECRNYQFLLAGSSNSSDGDHSQPNWDTIGFSSDYWIVKLDSMGNKIWDKRFGSNSDDFLSSIQQTVDGGYIIGGESSVSLSGDKTQLGWGNDDFWIVRIDSLGNKLWDKRFGGNDNDYLVSIINCSDGGFLLGGYTFSALSGDVSEPNKDPFGTGADYWIVKIDSLGNKVWDKKFGSDGNDIAWAFIGTRDNGCLIGGSSDGPVSEDKTGFNKGSVDYWVVKINAQGNKEWDKTFGGNYTDELHAIVQTSDFGFLFAGSSNSDSTFDKSSYKTGFWVVRTDSLGNKLWDQTYERGDLYSVTNTIDKGFLLSGISDNLIYADKLSLGLGLKQNWILKVDSQGNRLWDKTVLTLDSQVVYGGFSTESHDGGIVLGSRSDAGMGGEKTNPNKGLTSYFFIKYKDTLATNIIEEESLSNILFTIYPNPFQSEVNIHLESNDVHAASFTLTNAIGQVIYHSIEDNIASSYTKMLDLKALPSGPYFLSVEVNGHSTTNKLVKQ